jgi:virginiamycin B lyase
MSMPQSTSPGLIPPAPMAKTAILPSSVMNVRPQAAIQGANWTPISGTASYAAAAPDGSLWVLSDQPSGGDKYIWHYVSGTWTNIAGLASRLAVAPDGTLYAINSGGGAWKYSGGTWSSLGGGCSDITIANDGSIYVLSNGNSAGSDQAIWHYTTSWSQVPGAGVRIAGSWDPNTFAVSGGTVSAGGLYILNSIGSIYYENTSNSFVQLPGSASAIAPTTIGGVFVLGYPANTNGNNIYYYDLNSPGWTAQSGTGVSLSTDSTHLYVIGSTGGIYSSPVKTTSGTIVSYPVPSGAPNFITAGTDGNLWFTEAANKIGKITTGGTIAEFVIPTSGSGAWGITTGPDNNVWFAEGNGNKIGKITAAGTIVEYSIPTAGAGAARIAAGPDGNLWFTESNASRIGKITTGGTITEYLIPTNPAAPIGITAGPDGNVWFTDVNANKIGKVTTAGVFTEYSIPTASAYPYDITTGPDGNLWFTEFGSNKIGKISTNGAPIVEYSTPTTYSEPYGIAAGPDGNLWFAENGAIAGKIGKVTTSGTITEYTIPTFNAGPWGITAGPDGNLWFADATGNRIGKIAP